MTLTGKGLRELYNDVYAEASKNGLLQDILTQRRLLFAASARVIAGLLDLPAQVVREAVL